MKSLELLNHCDEIVTIKIHESINRIRIKEGYGVPERMINFNGYCCPKTGDYLMHLGDFYEQYPEYIKGLSEKVLQDLVLDSLIQEKLPTKLKTLDYGIVWTKNDLIVGCQTISKQDALKLAEAIQTMWGY